MLSVVVPVFNERESLAELHRRLVDSIERLGPYELILVDDGSSDGSWTEMLSLASRDPNIRLIRLSRNFGHQAALSAGLDAAKGDAVVLIDADLQDPPELIPELVARWHDGFDVVYAVRSERPGEPPIRRMAISLFYGLLGRISSQSIPPNAGDFRLLSRRAADIISAMPERARYLRGMSAWIGFRQTTVAYRRDVRHAGTSSYSYPRLMRLAFDGITSFSTTPIKLMTTVGSALVFLCLVVFGWTIYVRFFTANAPQGWTTVVVMLLLLGGVQLVSLGVLGQYVARIFEESKQRPLYLVDEVVETNASVPLDAAR